MHCNSTMISQPPGFFHSITKFLALSIFCFISLGGNTASVPPSDSFTVIKDGNEYLCERKIQPDPIGYLKCRETAYKGPFSSAQAETLCENSYTEAPALCGIEAYKGIFTTSEAITLCQSAKDLGPTECATKAYRGPFTKSEALEICKMMGSALNAECAITAYNGGYTKAEAIRICKAEKTFKTNLLGADGKTQNTINQSLRTNLPPKQ